MTTYVPGELAALFGGKGQSNNDSVSSLFSSTKPKKPKQQRRTSAETTTTKPDKPDASTAENDSLVKPKKKKLKSKETKSGKKRSRSEKPVESSLEVASVTVEESDESPVKKKKAKSSKGKKSTEAKQDKTEAKKASGKHQEREKTAEEKAAETEKNSRTVFVGNVPVGAKTQKELKRLFSPMGVVESVRLRSVPVAGSKVPANSSYKLVRKVSVNKGKFEEGKSCVAFVVFKEESVAKATCEKEWTLDGNILRLDLANSSKQDRTFERRRTVFVGNLPFIASENQVISYFTTALECDTVSVRLIRDPASNLGKGFGYVLLPSEDLMENALALNEQEFSGRKLRVSKCQRSKSDKASNVRKFQGVTAARKMDDRKVKKKIKSKKHTSALKVGGDSKRQQQKKIQKRKDIKGMKQAKKKRKT